MYKSKLHFWTLEILLIVGIIYICTKLSFLFNPIVIFLSTMFFPLLITGFLYFIFNPIVSLFEKAKIPRTLGILLIYVIFIGLVVLVIALIVPVLTQQVRELFTNIPKYIDQVPVIVSNFAQSDTFHWIQTQQYVDLDQVKNTLMTYLQDIPTAITNSISGLVGAVANVTLVIVTVPFLLFYLLKDGHKLPNAILRFLPSAYRKEGRVILKDTSNTLATYIQGQLIVSLCVGTLSFIGYLIIDLPYALLLGLAVAVTNIIPYVGPFLGAAPAFIVGLFISPMTAVLVVVVAVIAQQFEGNVISPLVIGRKLDTHPATIIIILLVAGNIAGILGMILGVPVYAVMKTLILNIVRLVRLYRKHRKEPKTAVIE
ncbi:AI-2E family transporter [Bacillus andreraoultii]|uniref:AI-2E family transporter n=1 Tax=Bacillus andreraoultii TaxID=1499685 RepID=UPI00053A499E|nr:AI-2E family transporter [Bacillus andreraoultii]